MISKRIALMSATALVSSVGVAAAADLPTRKAAPVQYVRICDAFGAGFFYIPGTDTCLKVGGTVSAQMRIQGANNMYSINPQLGGAIVPAAFLLPNQNNMRTGNGYSRDSLGFDASANIDLDARTQTGWGTLRTFIRLASTFGSGVNSSTGAYTGLLTAPLANFGGVGATAGKEFTYLNKAFIQFAGITMGRTQSFFDFYTDNYNYESLRGSNQNVWALAYTATFGQGFSATLSIEDPMSHRGEVSSVVYPQGLGVGANTVAAAPAASRLPDIIGALRVDGGWGAAQLAAALHPVRAALYSSGIGAAALSPFQPVGVTNSLGFAALAGVKFNLNMLSPGDVLWVQGVFARGAVGYTNGSNMSFTASFNQTQNYGRGSGRLGNSYGWNNTPDFDCVYTFSGKCDLSTSFAITAALKHFWTPTLSSALFGSYYKVSYSNQSLTPVGLNGTFGGGVTNYSDVKIGTNLVWTPVKGFDIGGELTYTRAVTSRPFGLASDLVLVSRGIPAFKSTTDAFYGKLRMQRAF